MPDSDRTDTVDMSIEPAPVLHPGHSDSWRLIPLWPSPAVDSAPARTPVQRTPEKRFAAELLARTTSSDPIHNPVTGALFFAANEEARTLNVSQHGLCLRCPRPPWVGARMLVKLLLSEDEPPVSYITPIDYILDAVISDISFSEDAPPKDHTIRQLAQQGRIEFKPPFPARNTTSK